MFKVGDKVRIKDLTLCDEDIYPHINGSMFSLSGNDYSISEVGEFTCRLVGNPWLWHFDWLEHVNEEGDIPSCLK